MGLAWLGMGRVGVGFVVVVDVFVDVVGVVVCLFTYEVEVFTAHRQLMRRWRQMKIFRNYCVPQDTCIP